jgi:hypothetical protein
MPSINVVRQKMLLINRAKKKEKEYSFRISLQMNVLRPLQPLPGLPITRSEEFCALLSKKYKEISLSHHWVPP